MRFLPTEAELKLLRQYERDRKPLEALSDEDRFMMQFSRIERLNQRMSIMTFMGNFNDNVQMLTPVRDRQTGRDRQTQRARGRQTDSQSLSDTVRQRETVSQITTDKHSGTGRDRQLDLTCLTVAFPFSNSMP